MNDRILFTAPKSGSGKTLITCGVIEALKRRGKKTASVKCGPDYIDPMFHRRVLGICAGNIDTFFTDQETTCYLLKKRSEGADITILEGVMGYYDGLGGQSEQGSTYEIAKVTETPAVLIVDGKGASVSLAALIKGIAQYRENSGIKGVILNRVSAGYFSRLKELIERECSLPVFGYLPELSELHVPSRYLGLHSPEEMDAFESWLGQAANAIEQTVDIEGILALAKEAPVLSGKKPEIPVLQEKVRIGVARDEAFSFYYTENLELLREMGAELVYFSPLHDKELPKEIDGLLLGGGYPERYAGELEAAVSMREDVRIKCTNGLPVIAECGGFLYLQRELEDEKGDVRAMAGVLPGKAYRTESLCRFGYISARIKTGGMLGGLGESIKGHEFHYWECTENGEDFQAQKPVGGKEYPCMVHTGHLAVGFPHFYYYSNPGMVFEFLKTCLRFQAGRKARRHWDGIAKPIDGLGLLERHVVKLCSIAGSPMPPQIKKRALVILCGDHGVVKEGVTQTGSEVTRIVAENFAKGCSTVNFMAKQAGVDVYTVDIGMNTPPYKEKNLVLGAVIDRKVSAGCGNIARQPAMTMEQCIKAVNVGRELVRELAGMGYRILATGEMGIGNTTPTSVLAALFLQLSAEDVTGRGAGLSDEGFEQKKRVVRMAIKRVKEHLAKGQTLSAMELLAQAGSYEIAGMTGLFLGAAEYGLPIVADGVISVIAALAADRMDKRVRDYLFASHLSSEKVAEKVLKELRAEALIHGRMHLGEGTGAMTLFPLLDMAISVYENMGSFEEYRIGAYERNG